MRGIAPQAATLSEERTTRATIEVHDFFSQYYPSIWGCLDLCRKLISIWRKLKLLQNRMKNPIGLLGVYNKKLCKKEMACYFFFPDDFGLRSSVIQIFFFSLK